MKSEGGVRREGRGKGRRGGVWCGTDDIVMVHLEEKLFMAEFIPRSVLMEYNERVGTEYLY